MLSIANPQDPYTSNLPTRYTPQREMERKIGESVDGKESTSAHETPGVCKAKGKLSDIELVQFARQITLGMVCMHGDELLFCMYMRMRNP